MSSEAELDLQELAVTRHRREQFATPRKRLRATRLVLPGAIIVAFVSLLIWAARDELMPRKAVTVVPVVVARAEARREGMPLFQAAGWIEPRPTAIHVAALTEGIVESLLVVEGQDVTKGEPVARLVDVDTKLMLREADAMLELRRAERQSAEAELKAARRLMEHPVHLEVALADAEAALASTETELAKLPFLIEASEARLEYARQNFAGKQAAGSGVSGRLLEQAKGDFATTQAELHELQQRAPRLRREVEALGKKRAALARQLELLIVESQQLENAQAKLLAAQSRLAQALIAVERAQLNLERTVVRSPVDGRVMQLMAHPGTRVMGLDPSAQQSSSTVVSLYDPRRLQVRADVRLEDVPLIQPGQPVEIKTASSKEPLKGVVLSPTSTANIQKNTLEVKVAIHDPPPTVRPEMLVTATFIAAPRPESERDDSRERETLLVPRSLVEMSGGKHVIWIVDPTNVARPRAVQLGSAGTEQLVEILEGLTLTDKLISEGRDGLRDGDRVSIAGEDPDLGLPTTRSSPKRQ